MSRNGIETRKVVFLFLVIFLVKQPYLTKKNNLFSCYSFMFLN